MIVSLVKVEDTEIEAPDEVVMRTISFLILIYAVIIWYLD